VTGAILDGVSLPEDSAKEELNPATPGDPVPVPGQRTPPPDDPAGVLAPADASGAEALAPANPERSATSREPAAPGAADAPSAAGASDPADASDPAGASDPADASDPAGASDADASDAAGASGADGSPGTSGSEDGAGSEEFGSAGTETLDPVGSESLDPAASESLSPAANETLTPDETDNSTGSVAPAPPDAANPTADGAGTEADATADRAGADPTSKGTGADPTGSGTGADPTGSGTGADSTADAAGSPAAEAALRPAVPGEGDQSGAPAAGQTAVAARSWHTRALASVLHPPLRQWTTTAVRASGRGVARSSRATWRWSRGTVGRFVVPTLVILLIVAGSSVSGRWLVPKFAPRPKPAAAAPNTAVPSDSPVPDPTDGTEPINPFPTDQQQNGAPARPVDALADWAKRESPAVGIPAVALAAYGYAQVNSVVATKDCHLTWTTLAGIGKVESNHGTANGAAVNAQGLVRPPIVGPALDGTNGNKAVPDTDGGLLDGDRVYDHAVGPMQFLPATWEQYKADADGDGVADPNDINDAALAAAGYLCAGGRDLSTPGGWWSAVLAYNAVPSYGQSVFDAADNYGRLSRTVT
jgi:hypothetical protein